MINEQELIEVMAEAIKETYITADSYAPELAQAALRALCKALPEMKTEKRWTSYQPEISIEIIHGDNLYNQLKAIGEGDTKRPDVQHSKRES